MGAVYEVERIADGARLALEMMSESVIEDPKAHRRFEREVQAGMEIRSERVVRTFASGVDEARGLPWLVMEIAPASERAAEYGCAESIPKGFDAWFARSVCRQEEHRFADAKEAGAALEDVWAGRAILESPAVIPTAKGTPPRVRPWVAVVVMGILVGVLAALTAMVAR